MYKHSNPTNSTNHIKILHNNAEGAATLVLREVFHSGQQCRVIEASSNRGEVTLAFCPCDSGFQYVCALECFGACLIVRLIQR